MREGGGKQACATHREGPGLCSQRGQGWPGWIAGLTPSMPTTQLIGRKNSSLGVGLCGPPLFTGDAEPSGWSPVGEGVFLWTWKQSPVTFVSPKASKQTGPY